MLCLSHVFDYIHNQFLLYLEKYSSNNQVDCVNGSFLALNLSKLKNYKIYDESVFLYGEELILGFEFKACGMKTSLIKDCFYNHLHGQTVKKNISTRSNLNIWVKSMKYIGESYYGINMNSKLIKLWLKLIKLERIYIG